MFLKQRKRWGIKMANKVSQIVNLRKQARAASKKDKIKLYPKIYKLMQQLSQVEWEHPIVKDLDKFFTTTKGGKWYAQQGERPVSPARPARQRRQPTGAAQRRPQKFDGSWGSGTLPIMAKVGHEDVDPYIVGKNGQRLSAKDMPEAYQKKLINDLKYVGYRGPFVVNDAGRSYKELFGLMKGRKAAFNFLNLENNAINNTIESFMLRTDMGKYYEGVDDRSKPWEHNTYTNAPKEGDVVRGAPTVKRTVKGPPKLKYYQNNWIQDFKKQLKDAGVSDRNVTKALAKMRRARGLLGGFQSDHVKHGSKVDFYQNMFNRPGGDIMLQKLQDERKWKVLPETAPSSGNSVFDVDLNAKEGSKHEFGNPQDQVIDSSRGYVIKAWKPYKEYDRDLTDDLKKKYKEAAERWQEHNIVKKTKREQPLVIEEAAEETITETPLTPETGMPYEDVSRVMEEVDRISPDLQTRATHPEAAKEQLLDQPELQQLDEEATQEDYIPGEQMPDEPQQFTRKDVSAVGQPTPYGIYAQGQPEFAAAEKEQVLAAKDGVFVEKDKIEEEAEMGPIFPGQKPVVQDPVWQEKGETIKGEAPITPEQLQAPQAEPVQKQYDPRFAPAPEVETVDEVVLEYVQGGKKSQEREKLNQMVNQGKTTREEIAKTIKKYDKAPEPKVEEPEDIMAAHARDMGQKPGPMMRKGLGLKKEEVEKISKAPKPKPDVVEESEFEKVIKSISGIPSDTDKKQIYDPDTYAKEMMAMDQKFQADIKQAMKDEAEADVELQKVEPYRFWHSMGTPAKIISALGALVAGYALPAEGAAAAYNMINSAIDADVKSQQLDLDHAMRTRKEATRRATNAIERRAKLVGNPETRFKIMEISRNLKMNQAVKDKNDFKTRMKAKIMRNPAEAEQLFKYNPQMYQQIYTKDEIKHHRKVNDNYKKALKDNNVSNVINAANAMENTFMDIDWKKVKGKMKLMKYDIAEPSGAGDMALVFSFMKMLDPGSVVREGEFKTAAGMNPQYLYFARKWNKFMEGEMFTTKDRLAFMGEVNRMLKSKVQDAQRVYKMYSGDLTRQGYPSTFILGKPISMGVLPSMRVNKVIDSIMKKKGVDREEAIKLFKAGRKRLAAKKRGVKFDKTGKPARPGDEGKPLIGNKQFPIQSRIW